jgi:hypothetical protein
MLTAPQVEAFLRKFEPLQHVLVEEQSQMIYAPWLVRLHGTVSLHGEIHAFETDLDLREFGSAEDLLLLANQLMKSFEQASRRTHV